MSRSLKSVLLPLLLALVMSAAPLVIGGTPLIAQAPACFATPDDGATIFNTVQEAVDAAPPGGTVKVAGTCEGVETRNGTGQSAYIDKDLTLRGGYTTADWFTSDPVATPATIDALGLGRVLFIDSPATAGLENITLTGGTVSGNSLCPDSCGGGILAMEDVILSGVTLTGNHAGRDGGGLAAMAAASVTDSAFSGNTADFDGAGLLVSGDAIIAGSTFEANTAILAGGGAQVEGAAQIVDTRFLDNESTHNVGGALRLRGDSTIQDSTFTGNIANSSTTGLVSDGGAVYAFDVSLDVAGSHFEDNHTYGTQAEGGAIYAGSAFNAVTLSLTNSTLVNNSAGNTGGGAYVNGQAVLAGGRFEGNHAFAGFSSFENGGGGLHARDLALDGTEFVANSTGKSGGGAWVDASAVLVGGSFRANTAAHSGGGFASPGFLSSPDITGTEFVANSAELDGGGVWVQSGGLVVAGALFDTNTTANGNGGGLWVSGDLALDGVTFDGNVARDSGGGAFANTGDVTLQGGAFTANEAFGTASPFSDGGGGLWAGGTLQAGGTRFEANASQSQGGGVWVFGAADLTDVSFDDNHAALAGGGFFGRDTVQAVGSTFASNSAANAGGGAYADGPAGISGSTFQFNASTAGSGGGLYAGSLIIAGSQFLDNSAEAGGGGAAVGFGAVDVSGSLFQGNSTAGSGGGLRGSFDPVSVTTSEFTANSAESGGGGITAFGTLTLVDSLLQDNQSAAGNGGGAYTSGVINPANTQFLNNSAFLDGGGAWANSGANVVASLFEGNASGGSGGGLAAPLGNLTVDAASTFAGNSAGLSGGGAYAFNATLNGGTFRSNQASDDGGGLRTLRFLNVYGALFIDNSAGKNGGGVAAAGSYGGTTGLELANPLFAGNSAALNGSAVYLDIDRPVSIKHATIGAPAPIAGQAIYASLGTVDILNSIISGHDTGIQQAGSAVVNEDYNLFFGNTADTAGTVTAGGNSTGGDPAFADPSNDDYHLTATSAALDAATDAGLYVDFEGDARPYLGGIPDVGFDEAPFIANTAPVANDDAYDTDEDTALIIAAPGVLANDTDADGDPLAAILDTPPASGDLTLNDDGSFTYTPDAEFCAVGIADSFTYHASDGLAGSNIATVEIEVICVDDAPEVTVSTATQDVQYSDHIAPVTIHAVDSDSPSLSLALSPPSALTVSEACAPDGAGVDCTWTLEGQVLVAAGTYDVDMTVSDGASDVSGTTQVVVSEEDATAWFDPNNEVAFEVDTPGGDSGPFALTVFVKELLPDAAGYLADLGDISLADVTVTLAPVGPGSGPTVACAPVGVSGSGYDAVLEATCAFEDVAVNTYHAQASLSGGHYLGEAEDVVVVFDPSLGFTTGGGWFYWPGTDEKTNFGYTMKYNRKGTKVQGNLLIIRHVGDEAIYRVKSNAIDGLSLGEFDDGGVNVGWASFSGKTTYKEPGWQDPLGNHRFVVYVEDRGDPGNGLDRFWLEVTDGNGNLQSAMSLPREAPDNSVTLGGGNIVVPHTPN